MNEVRIRNEEKRSEEIQEGLQVFGLGLLRRRVPGKIANALA